MKHRGMAIMSLDNFNSLVLMKSTPEDDLDFKLNIAFFTCVSVTGVREKCRFLPSTTLQKRDRAGVDWDLNKCAQLTQAGFFSRPQEISFL